MNTSGAGKANPTFQLGGSGGMLKLATGTKAMSKLELEAIDHAPRVIRAL
jgi:hypothetical protein